MDVEALLSHNLPSATIRYQRRDAILYALGVGCGAEDLPHVYEDGLRTLPFYGLALGYTGFWLRDPALKIDWVRILHAEQRLEIARPLPPEGEVEVAQKLIGVRDKAEKGALIWFEKTLSGPDGLYCRAVQGVFARGDGGCGDHGDAPAPLEPPPDRAPDTVIDRVTDPRAAAIYRLSGDLNPLHIDPEIARQAGYDRPILHGLCSMGVSGLALMAELDGFGGFSCRFSAPVYPGETLRTEIWREAAGARFRATIPTRRSIVLDRGFAVGNAPAA